ncbi:MAG TPA: S1C family serine protease [Caulobacteraceae bacterium]|nr:S1C family serine protease [Caulobacteraceae bacterium]
MASVFDGFEVEERYRPDASAYAFDLERVLSSVVVLEAHIPEDAYSAQTLGAERAGNAIVIGADGLLLTIGYLITEADDVVLTTNDGRRIPAHPLGTDQATGFGLVYALEPLGLPALPLGDSRKLRDGARLISVGGGGRAHALASRLVAREAFAGYWEYHLDEALFVAPGHPHWQGAALIGAAGEVVGVGSLGMEQLDRDGAAKPINMFVPAELLPPILDGLAKGGQSTPPRPWLGALWAEVQGHIVVAGVTPGGPSSRAELRRGDIIHRIGGHPVDDLSDFYKRLWALGPPGVLVPLTVQREDDVFDMEIRSGDRLSRQRKRTMN